MCPRYPYVASRAPRLRTTAPSACRSNGADAATCGPSLTKRWTMAPPMTASIEELSISVRHDRSAALHDKRCGNAEPRVNAPTTTPSALPRRSRNQPAAIFIPGGYTHASAAPVSRRSAMMVDPSDDQAIAAFAAAPATQPAANSRRALKTSARLSTALISVPATNPPCTAMVSHAVADSPRASSDAMRGAAAVAENHSVIPKNCPRATSASIRCGIWRFTMGENAGRMQL